MTFLEDSVKLKRVSKKYFEKLSSNIVFISKYYSFIDTLNVLYVIIDYVFNQVILSLLSK
jgi:hypothetical protein